MGEDEVAVELHVDVELDFHEGPATGAETVALEPLQRSFLGSEMIFVNPLDNF